MARWLLLGLLVSAVLTGCTPAANVSDAPISSDEVLARAYQEGHAGIQVAGSGHVVRILGDDNEGGRHQRFILELDSGQTLLVAHNIDVAPRIPSLREGDVIEFYGVYEWNDEGGVIHWTHHDPAGRHEPGWLKHGGALYQ
ncbi:MAG: DUF3465 domain-containing protein [Anaerosomatales bacterium]|nr:DUF3465 domain-containing protein [Anaerosomatales bacterium]MDT8434153.1 DUF3465 domain-containing protein [Anaerosomatales bacterium]